VQKVESHVFGFMPPVLEKAVLILKGRWKLLSRGKPGGKRAVARLSSGNIVDHRMAAMLSICLRYWSTGIMQVSADRMLIFTEQKELVIYCLTQFGKTSILYFIVAVTILPGGGYLCNK